MPFPWKKVRSTRISQLVNDHLNISQKRRDGSSLVVETGFPTSLIDLFIKNREKLKKPSKKKRHSQPITSPNDAAVIEGSPLSCPSPLPPPPPSLAGSPSPPQRQSTVLPPPSSGANEICVVGSSDGAAALDVADAEERGGESGGDVNEVLIGVLKIFVVVVLALSTKRLTVGITISAVLLLLLEYVGKHCRRLSKPCAAAMMPMVQIGGRLLSYKKLEKKQEPLTNPVSSRFPVQEIQVFDSTAASAEEIQPEKEMTEAVSLPREILGYQEIELVEMAMKREESISNLVDCKRKSRKAKIRSKMKKIVPKKFRAPKKEHDLPIILCEEQVYHSDNIEDSENGSISSSVSDYSEEDGKSSTVCFDRRLSDVIEEVEETNIGCKIEAAVARRYMLLGLIVLAGLIGGRLFALVLTLSWFLLLKLGQALPRSVELPMILSFNVKSG